MGNYSYKKAYRKNCKKNDKNMLCQRIFFTHEIFCNYLPNNDYLIFFDESGINEKCTKELYWSRKGKVKYKYE